jgi:type IV secretion system protein VirB11
LRYDLEPAICAALTDHAVTEIKVGDDGKLWLRKHVVGWQDSGVMIAADHRLRAVNTMASLLGKTLNPSTPLLSGELPLTGDRVEASIPPSSPAPSFVIRRHAPEIYPLSDYVSKGILEPWQANALATHVQRRSNIVFSGATNSGKTTLANACLQLIGSTEHVVIIEDTEELQCAAPNMSRYKTGDPHPTMQEQVKRCMRRAPDRLVIGETRDKAGLELLKAWDTGHRGGITTVHATNASRVFDRFAQFCEEAGVPPQWRLMRSAIDLICHVEMTPQGRRLTEMVEVRHAHDEDDIPVHLVRLGPPQAVDQPVTNGGNGYETSHTNTVGSRSGDAPDGSHRREGRSHRDGEHCRNRGRRADGQRDRAQHRHHG